MKFLEAEGKNTIALIVGDYLQENKNLYDQLIQNKPNNVHFVGKVNNVGDYLIECRCFSAHFIYMKAYQ